jgi:aminopeptidase-like protein
VTGVPLDHWAGFVLSLVDGLTSVQDIVDLSPMPEHEVLNVLDRLHEHGLIRIRRRRARA